MSDPVEKKFLILAAKNKDCNELVNRGEYPRIENVNWVISVSTANDREQNIMEPHALIRLKLFDKVTNSSSTTVLDYNEEECIKFYELLEDVQRKLDDVYKE